MLQSLVNSLNQPAMTVWGTPMSWAEVLGFATGLLCVWLVGRHHILNFPVGIANCALLFLLFFDARLFADAGLQVVFILLGFQGWWLWSRGVQEDGLALSRLNMTHWIGVLGVSVLLTGSLYLLLTWAKGSVPLADAVITSLSLSAQWLLNRRKLESWYFWIVVDLISIPLYAYKQLYLIALLYLVFLGLCVVGLRAWRREMSSTVVESIA